MEQKQWFWCPSKRWKEMFYLLMLLRCLWNPKSSSCNRTLEEKNWNETPVHLNTWCKGGHLILHIFAWFRLGLQKRDLKTRAWIYLTCVTFLESWSVFCFLFLKGKPGKPFTSHDRVGVAVYTEWGVWRTQQNHMHAQEQRWRTMSKKKGSSNDACAKPTPRTRFKRIQLDWTENWATKP